MIETNVVIVSVVGGLHLILDYCAIGPLAIINYKAWEAVSETVIASPNSRSGPGL